MLALSIKALGEETSWTVRGKTFDHNFILETRLGLPLSRAPITFGFGRLEALVCVVGVVMVEALSAQFV